MIIQTFMKGKLIGIDGMNGVGKTTLIEELKMAYPDAFFVREPGGTSTGNKIREILLNRDESIDPIAEYLLFAADHHQTMDKVILPALNSEKIVITDRTFVSSLAFQGALGVSTDLILNISHIKRGYDKIIILDASWETLQERMRKRGGKLDSIESRGDELKVVHENFRKWADVLISTDGKTPHDVYESVKRVINDEIRY